MLSVLTAVLGFLGPFIPELIKIWGRKVDNQHEIALLAVQVKQAELEHERRLEVINTTADVQEMATLRQPFSAGHSYGVAILDALRGDNWPRWIMLPLVYLFAFLDFLIGAVRPLITYAAFGFYIVYKWARFKYIEAQTGDAGMALTNLWTESDWAVLTLVLGFWFGQRTAQRAFGTGAKR